MNLKSKIAAVQSKPNASWIKKVQERSTKRWLRLYSSEIARRVIFVLKQKEMTQIDLAEKLEVKPQRINKIVKGQENLTLETIYKLSEALNFQLISFPPYGWMKPIYSELNLLEGQHRQIAAHHPSNVTFKVNSESYLMYFPNDNEKKISINSNSPFIGDIEIVND